MTKFDIDADMVRQLAKLLAETGLNEIEYAEGERRIRLMRGAPAPVHAVAAPAATAVPAVSVDTAPAPHAGAITSPMVGTVYLSAEPGGAPFVKIGDTIKPGDTLLIIEAMKVMNPIKATTAGVIKDILVRDSTPVEFGEILMIVA